MSPSNCGIDMSICPSKCSEELLWDLVTTITFQMCSYVMMHCRFMEQCGSKLSQSFFTEQIKMIGLKAHGILQIVWDN